MGIGGALAAGRLAAEARMVDEAAVTRSGGEPVFDPGAGGYVTPAGSSVYVGQCEVQVSGLTVQAAEVGGAEIGLRRLTVKFPITAPEFWPNDVVELTASEHNAHLVGRRFRVESIEAKTFPTCLRIQCEEVVHG